MVIRVFFIKNRNFPIVSTKLNCILCASIFWRASYSSTPISKAKTTDILPKTSKKNVPLWKRISLSPRFLFR